MNRIPVEDVVFSEQVNTICQDAKGYMWFGTYSGLVRFDGYDMEVFHHQEGNEQSVCSDRIVALSADASGNIWVGTSDKGISVYNINNNKWGHIMPSVKDKSRIYPFVHNITDLQNGYVAITSYRSEVLIVNQKTYEYELLSLGQFFDSSTEIKYCRDLIVDAKNKDIWWIGTNNGVVKYNNRTKGGALFQYGNNSTTKNNRFNAVKSLAQDGECLYLGTWGRGLLVYNKKTNEFDNFHYNAELRENLTTNVIHDIVPMNDSMLWVATADKGLGIFNKEAKEFHFYKYDPREKYGTLEGHSICLYKDDVGNLWSGFFSGLGLVKARSLTFFKYKLPDVKDKRNERLHYPVFSEVVRSKSKMLVASYYGNGLNLIDLKTQRVENFKPKYYSDKSDFRFFVSCFPYSDDEYLIVTIKGICYFNVVNNKWRYINEKYNKKIARGRIRSAYLSEKEVLVVGTFNGSIKEIDLKTLDIKEWTASDEVGENKVLESAPVNAVFFDERGNIIASTSNGIVIINKGTSTVTSHYDKSGVYGDMRCYCTDAVGRVWTTSMNNGVVCLDPNMEYKIVDSITIKDELASNNIFDVDIDDSGRVWVSTNRALQCFSTDKKLLLTLREKQGLPPRFTGWSNIHIVGDVLHLNWHNNVSIASISQLLAHSSLKPLVVNGLYNKDVALDPSSEVRLDYDQNFLRIKFSGFDYSYYSDLLFSYRLNKDMDWVTLDRQNEINLIGLAPNSYVLEVQKESATYSEKIVVPLLTFSVHPPFYKTWWFLLLVFCIATGLIVYIYRMRFKNFKKVEQVRTELNKKVANLEMEALRSQMNPHFIFNSLNSIKYFIVKKQSQDATLYLDKFARLTRMVLDMSKNDMVTLSEELAVLKLYCQLEQMRFNHHFEFSINISEGVDTDTLAIPPLLLQPHVENAVWHGLMQRNDMSGRLDIFIESIVEGYQFRVVDNGVGRSKARELKSKSSLKRKSHGVKITNDRIAVFNQLNDGVQLSISILDKYDENTVASGTEVIIKLMHKGNE